MKINFNAIFTGIILYSTLLVSAKQTNLDSLFTIWEDKSIADTIRLKAITKIAKDGYLFTQPDSAFYYAQLQFDFAKSKSLKKQMADALNMQGITFAIKGDYPQALNYYQKSLKISEDLGTTEGIAVSLSNIGLIYALQGDYSLALNYYQKSLKIQQEVGDKKGISKLLNNIGVIYTDQGNYPQALSYYQRSLKIQEEIGDKDGMAAAFNNIGDIHTEQGNYTQALKYHQRSLEKEEEIGDKRGIATSLINIGIIYQKQRDYLQALNYCQRSLKIAEEIGDKNGIATSQYYIGTIYADHDNSAQALNYHQRSLKIREEIGDKSGIAKSLYSIGLLLAKQGKNKLAIIHCQQALTLSEEIGVVPHQKEACLCLYNANKALGNVNKALAFFEQMIILKDSIYNEENTEKMTRLEMQYDFDKKEAIAQTEQLKKDAVAGEELKSEKLRRNGFMGGFAVVLVFAGIFFSQRNKVKAGKKKSDELLLNILPAEIAEELKEKGSAQARHFDLATILFTDFKGFTQQSEKMSPTELVSELNHCFKAFDEIIEKHGIEKIKTIGDSYMAAGGLPVPTKDSVKNTVLAALEIQAFVIQRKIENDANNKPAFQMRVGINTGPVVAGIVGIKKFQYDVWGDTVNTASRMESSGEVGKVNISKTTYDLLKDDTDFLFESRGKIKAKGKGEIEMYFVSRN